MPYEDFDRLFPQGPGARQERYIAAFNGLTALIAANRDPKEAKGVRAEQPWRDEWWEMFERLTEEGQ